MHILCILCLMAVLESKAQPAEIGDTLTTYVYYRDVPFFIDRVPNQFWVRYKLGPQDLPVATPPDSIVVHHIHNAGYIVKGDSATLFAMLQPDIDGFQPTFKHKPLPPEYENLREKLDSNYIVSSEILLYPIAGKEAMLEDYIAGLHVSGLEKDGKFWTVTVHLGQNSVALANQIAERGYTVYCNANHYIQMEVASIPNDPYYGKQFYLRNTGQVVNNGASGTSGADINIEPAWDLTKGDTNVKIAVVDEGVTNNHPDMPSSSQLRFQRSNLSTGLFTEANTYDASNIRAFDPNLPSWIQPDDPSPSHFFHNYHGNACAGIIAAQHNNQGIAGIAPKTILVPIKVPFPSTTVGKYRSVPENIYSLAIRLGYMDYVDVSNNSYGGTGYPYESSPTIETAIKDMVAYGRGGRGTVVLFCAHNFGVQYPQGSLPALIDVPGLIVVGATDMNDQKPPYSNYGLNVDIAAPSGRQPIRTYGFNYDVWTADIPGNAGANPWHQRPEMLGYDDLTVGATDPATGPNNDAFTAFFSGTSASTPMVAAVAGLMISENPCLYATEVETVLKRNADKVGGYNYYSSPVAGFSQELGYGRLNAYKAITDPQFQQNVTYTGVMYTKAGTLTAGKNVTGNMPVGNVTVKSGADVNYRGVYGVTMTEGFSVEPGATFLAECVPVKTSCARWDDLQMPSLDQQAIMRAAGAMVVQPKANAMLYGSKQQISENLNKLKELQINRKIEVDIYPNPALQSGLELKFSHVLMETANVEIYNMQGTLVGQWKADIGQHTLQLDIAPLQAGVYTISLVYEGKSTVKRIVKL